MPQIALDAYRHLVTAWLWVFVQIDFHALLGVVDAAPLVSTAGLVRPEGVELLQERAELLLDDLQVLIKSETGVRGQRQICADGQRRSAGVAGKTHDTRKDVGERVGAEQKPPVAERPDCLLFAPVIVLVDGIPIDSGAAANHGLSALIDVPGKSERR